MASTRAVANQLSLSRQEPISTRRMLELAESGDAAAGRLIEDAGRAIGIAVANLCNIVNPECVVVGGDLALAGDVLLDPIREVVRRNAIPSAAADTEIVAGVLGERAEMLGALALVMQESERFAAPGRSEGGMNLRYDETQPKGAPMSTQMRSLASSPSPRCSQRWRSAPAATTTAVTPAARKALAEPSPSCCPRRRRRGTRRSTEPLFEAKVEELCPDCDILYQNADQDPAKQQQQVEAAVTEGVDVMVLDPVDSTTAGALATRAKDADIPVISYDRLILDADLDYYVAFDSLEVGRQQATALSERLAEDGNPEGPIVKINGDPKDNNAALFKEGSNEVFEEEGVEIAQEYDTPDWLAENAQREMEQAITAVGKEEIKGVYAANDTTAGGAIAAMKSGGMDPEKVPVTGQDAELAGVQRIIAGEQFMTVYKPIQPLAEAAAELAVDVANGEEPSSDLVSDETDNGTEAVPTAHHRDDPGHGRERQRHDHRRRGLPRRRDLHRPVREGLPGGGHQLGPTGSLTREER